MTHKIRASSPKLTAVTAAWIKYLWNNTNMNQAQIASKLGALNQGRVCEVVTGRRYPDVQPASGV